MTPGKQKPAPRTKTPVELCLDRWQIMKRKALLEIEGITPEYIDGHIQAAIAEDLWDNPIGMAITRMLAGYPVPEQKERSHKAKEQHTHQPAAAQLSEWTSETESTICCASECDEPKADGSDYCTAHYLDHDAWCIHQDELPETLPSGRHRMSPFCRTSPVIRGTRYCQDHQQ